MKNLMQRLILAGVTVCTLALSANCAPNSNPLGLTPAQKAKITALEKKGRAEVTAVQNGLIKPADKKAKIEAIVNKYKEAELAVLTPSQRAQVRKQENARDTLAKQLKQIESTLTPKQREKGRDITNKYQKEARYVVGNGKLTRTQKLERLKKLQAEQNAALRAILTQKQRAQLENLRKGVSR